MKSADKKSPGVPPEVTVVPRGFRADGVAAGIKKKAGVLDLGLVLAEGRPRTAGMFTTNAFCAAPVHWDRELVARGYAQALVTNSGNANCATGAQGKADCAEMAALVADGAGCSSAETLVASTGVIGVPLPMEKMRAAIPALSRTVSQMDAGDPDALKAGWTRFAESIMTTDTIRKIACATCGEGPQEIRFLGMAKGSGMIHPDMATMLAFIFTDAQVDGACLKAWFAEAVAASFNSLTVDGDTSTNDTALILASGAAGGAPITADAPMAAPFREALNGLCRDLARQVVSDGEGATRIAEIRVLSAASEADARRAARAVATSSLVKTALYGQDANWGRIACAVGYSGAAIHPEKTDISIGPLKLLDQGRPVPFNEEEAARILAAPEVTITIDLGMGTASAAYWTCDLSHEYVSINADYRS